MMSFKLALLAASASAALAGPALAQTAPAPTQAPAQTPAAEQEEDAQVEDVVVTGRATDVRTSIDSTSYSLANDLQASRAAWRMR